MKKYLLITFTLTVVGVITHLSLSHPIAHDIAYKATNGFAILFFLPFVATVVFSGMCNAPMKDVWNMICHPLSKE